MALRQRLGLASLADSGEVPSYRDWNQLVKALAATRTVIALLLGGEGVYLGLETDPTDVVPASGSAPLVLAVADDSGYVYWFYLVADAAIEFAQASGTLDLYAVVQQESDVSPALASAGLNQVQFVADTVAPAHGLLLGSGTVVDASFTSWTEAAGARITGGPLIARALADADGDTRVRVEAAADEDTLRLETAGVERAVLDADKLALSVGLVVNGPITLGDADTDTVTCTGRLILRDLASSNPSSDRAGSTGEMAFNSTDSKAWLCTTGGAAGSAIWTALS